MTYNGIGLQTPRGSGTSGYIERNLSYRQNFQTKDQFLKELQQLRDNILPPPKKANPQIVEHQIKREIFLELEKLRERYKEIGKSEEEIKEKVEKAQKILEDKYAEGAFKTEAPQAKDSHQAAIHKEKQQTKLMQTLAISQEYKPGSAFDFESQERVRLQKKYEQSKRQIEKIKQLKEQKEKEKKEKKKAEKDKKKEEKKQRKIIKKMEKEKQRLQEEEQKEKIEEELRKEREKKAKEQREQRKQKERSRSRDRKNSKNKKKSRKRSYSSEDSRSSSSESNRRYNKK